MSARTIMRRTARIPAAAHRAVAHLWDTLDWLNPWHDVDTFGEHEEDPHHGQEQHLSLHL
jgi:hypothetical protein